jgi:hypothetical protein
MIRHLKLTHGDRLTLNEGEAIIRAIEGWMPTSSMRGPDASRALAKIRRALDEVTRRRAGAARGARQRALRKREPAPRIYGADGPDADGMTDGSRAGSPREV